MLIGRKHEQSLLKLCVESKRAEFIAVYGRRRIGKTFLIKQYFNNKFSFYVTGIYNASKEEQLKNFYRQLNTLSTKKFDIKQDWYDAFNDLKIYLSSLKTKNIIVFFDEMPWLDTHNSKFIKALELFWNSWGADCERLKLIVCGSATTWMMEKLIANKGGLHNRVTLQMHLSPFSLGETEEFLKKVGIEWNRYQIIELYMILGGVPFYLTLLEKNLSFAANINALFLGQNGKMRNEYDIFFNSLFVNSNQYKTVVSVMAKKNLGTTRNELVCSTKIDGGQLTKILKNLETCDFIRHYNAFGMKERGVMYQLTDNFTLFYHKFQRDFFSGNEDFWQTFSDTPKHNSWSGYAFEQVCLNHLAQIKKALGINGIHSEICSWSSSEAQIDLLINRNDQVISLCEMKYSRNPYELKKNYYEKLIERRELFRSKTKTNKALQFVFVTTYPLKRTPYSDMIQQVLTADDLFE